MRSLRFVLYRFISRIVISIALNDDRDLADDERSIAEFEIGLSDTGSTEFFAVG
ncbi:MAG: hypothetical protein J7641_12025 [Cyanobacteria bacterium SID2]|nr:hypothetical protein [Cyanobacteria bacterium SID2]MBP0003031.1 hypothetical protein [Cyanobacteria bacterium SBC]